MRRRNVMTSNSLAIRRHQKFNLELIRVLVGDGFSRRKAREISFHMLDWRRELEALHALYQDIEKKNDVQILSTVRSFLSHAPHHLNAAKFLYGFGAPSDLFQLGFNVKRSMGRRRAVSSAG